MKLTRILLPLIFATALLTLGFSLVQANTQETPTDTIIYVDSTATGANDGTSWANAYTDLQDALTTAVSGTQIWVAEGIYKPTAVITERTASFNLVNGVAMYGGFPAGGGTFNARDWEAHPTVLSGDIDNNDLAVPAENTDQIVGGNSYHVVRGETLGASTLLDGFIISGGQADGDWQNENMSGGGIYVVNSTASINLANTRLRGNRAEGGGGGIYSFYSYFTLTNVSIQNNLSDSGGGGILLYSGEVNLHNTIFSDNYDRGGDGGGIYCYECLLSLWQVYFLGNRTNFNGGGIFIYVSPMRTPVLTNVYFVSNSAQNKGGGLYTEHGGHPLLTNVVFTNNLADYGGGMYNDSVSTISHTTFNNNSARISGGAIQVDFDSRLVLIGSSIMHNSANTGGGISSYGDVTLIDTNLSYNSATTAAGGMLAYNGPLTLLGTTFFANTSGSGPGGLHASVNVSTFTNVVFSNNVAQNDGGGILFLSGVHTLTNVTILNNVAGAHGGGMSLSSGTFHINNAIVWGNHSNDRAISNQQIMNYSPNQTIIQSTIIQGSGGSGSNWDTSLGIDGGGNLDANPRFVRPPNPGQDTIWGTEDDDYGDLRLQTDSPAIDAGDNNALPADSLDLDGDGNTTEPVPLDIAGNARFVDIVTTPDTGITSTLIPNQVVDMGAYETQPFISLAQTVIPQRAGPGQQVTYLLTFHNIGPDTATGILLTDTVPISVTLTDITASLPITQVSGFPNYIWQVADLPVGARGIITLTGIVTTSLDGSETLWSTSGITAAQPDPAPLDNRSRVPLYINEIIYVDSTANGTGSGTSWRNAYTDLQSALSRAHPGAQIWVAEGIYKPTSVATDRTATFRLVAGVEIYGGFPTGGDIFARRDPEAHPTVLSGDIGNNDITDPRGIITHTSRIRGGNSYHVLTAEGLRDITLLDGFSVTGGQANAAGYTYGGGLYHTYDSHLRLRRVTFTGNYAIYGGGVYSENSHPTLVDVTFCGNTAQTYGGGLYTDNNPLSLTNARFYGNQANLAGGGIYNNQGSPALSNVLFTGNRAGDKGGGMLNNGGSPTLTNVTFANNHADYLGGGMYNQSGSTPQIANGIFWGNTYGQGTPAPSQVANASGTVPEFRHTLIQGAFINSLWDTALGLDAGGNIDADPAFVQSPDPGADGLWGTLDDDYGDLHLQAQSAAIDAGDNSAVALDSSDLDGDKESSEPTPYDLDNAPRFTDVTTTPNTGVGEPPIVDMGAYEAQLRLRVRVTQEDGTPAPDAVIYHWRAATGEDALPIGGQENPLRTNLQGIIEAPGGFQAGDGLLAAWPITTTEKYTVYLTSAAPVTSGLVWKTITDTKAVQHLIVRRTYPLTVFNLEVSLEWDARNDPLFLQQLRYDLQRSADLLYDWTNGQATLGRIIIYYDRDHWNEADIRIYATNRLRPNATVGGIVLGVTTDPYTTTITYRPGQVNMGAIWNRFGDPNGNLGEDWPRALAHELAHYLLFQEDNYLGVDPELGLVVPIEGCTGVMTNPYRNDDENGYDEFHSLTGWDTDCANTLSNLETQRHDWGTIVAFYPWMHENPLNFGPNQLPLAITRIVEIQPPGAPNTLEVPIFYIIQNGEILMPGNSARVFLFQPDKNALIDLGRPLLDQVLAWGARPGDRLCVFELDANRLGCTTVSKTNSALELHTLSNWHPDVIVSPVTSRTIGITVSNVPTTGIALQGKLYPLDGNPSGVITLTQIAGGYSGTFELTAPALEGHIHLWVSDDPEPRREMLVDFGLGGSPGLRRPKDGSASPVVSPNGQIIIYGPALNFPKGEFYTIQAATVIPEPPLWTYIVGSAYYLSASANAPSLDDGISIIFNYLGDDILSVDEQWLKVYFWDGSAWIPLTTTLNTRYNLAAAPTQGEGLYALMASIESQLIGPAWNSIVYPVQETRPITKALASIDGNFTQVCRYNTTVSNGSWQCFNAGNVPAWVNDLLEMEYGAYWLFATQNTTLYLKPDPLNLAATQPKANHTLGSPPVPPAIFYGNILPNGNFIPEPGMQVKAWLNGHLCGQSETFTADNKIVYVLKVSADNGGDVSGCGIPGRPITFTVNWQGIDVWAGFATWENIRAQETTLSSSIRIYLPLVLR